MSFDVTMKDLYTPTSNVSICPSKATSSTQRSEQSSSSSKVLIKTVFFDVTGVLAKLDLTRLNEFAQKDLGFSQEDACNLEKSSIDSKTWKQEREHWKMRLGKSYKRIQAIRHESLVMDPEVVNIVKKLQSQGIRVGILSNGGAKSKHIYAKAKNLVDIFLISSEIGCKKPETKAFLKMLEVCHCSPSECLLIDDLERNVTAAKKLGIDSILFVSPADIEHALSTRSLFQISNSSATVKSKKD
jgi:HAD superfamily hydrolase (TIGR01509 family)